MNWKFWQAKQPEPIEHVHELLELIVKAGRRCAYDLKHAAHSINDREWSKVFSERADHWLTIFDPADGPKDYRARLQMEVQRLQRDIRVVKDAAKKAGVDIEYIDFWGDHDED